MLQGISGDSVVDESTQLLSDKISIKRSMIGRHCVLGEKIKVINSVIMDHVVIGERYSKQKIYFSLCIEYLFLLHFLHLSLFPLSLPSFSLYSFLFLSLVAQYKIQYYAIMQDWRKRPLSRTALSVHALLLIAKVQSRHRYYF